MILIFCSVVFPLAILMLFLGRTKQSPPLESQFLAIQPFSVADYLDRMEKAHVELLREQKPVGQTIILWWGLDGLKLNEEGELEWVSRDRPKAPEPVEPPEYQMCNTIQTQPQTPLNTQLYQLQRDNLTMQLWVAQMRQYWNIQQSLQQCCVSSYPAYGPAFQQCSHPAFAAQYYAGPGSLFQGVIM